MSPAPKKRSTILVAVGAGVFVVGTGLAAFATKDSGGAEAPPPASVTTTTAAAGVVAAQSGAVDFVIPAGHQAISVAVPFVPGVSGYPKAGSFVNVYGAYASIPITASPGDPMGKLVLPKVKVLAVQPGQGDTTYVLAVSTREAEAIVYLTNFQKVYLTLARDDQGAQTPEGFSDDDA